MDHLSLWLWWSTIKLFVILAHSMHLNTFTRYTSTPRLRQFLIHHSSNINTRRFFCDHGIFIAMNVFLTILLSISALEVVLADTDALYSDPMDAPRVHFTNNMSKPVLTTSQHDTSSFLGAFGQFVHSWCNFVLGEPYEFSKCKENLNGTHLKVSGHITFVHSHGLNRFLNFLSKWVTLMHRCINSMLICSMRRTPG